MTHETLMELLKTARPIIRDETALKTMEMFPHWENTIGRQLTQENMEKGHDRYQYRGKLYRLVQPHTPQEDWTPDSTPALWIEVSLEEWPNWRQPTGAQDAYQAGDKVTWKEKRWISDVDANTWEPGAYGWTEYAVEEATEPEIVNEQQTESEE